MLLIEKLSARELEDLLHEHPDVRSVAVVAVPDERTGERACACACVVPQDPAHTPTLGVLAEFLDARGISRRKLPKQLQVFDELPMTASGKVKKHELRELLGTAPRRADEGAR